MLLSLGILYPFCSFALLIMYDFMTLEEKKEYFYSRMLTADNMSGKIYWDNMLTQVEGEIADAK